ncbi:MAG: hypothetical protein ACXWDI_04535 [Nocardioides sp.]
MRTHPDILLHRPAVPAVGAGVVRLLDQGAVRCVVETTPVLDAARAAMGSG